MTQLAHGFIRSVKDGLCRSHGGGRAFHSPDGPLDVSACLQHEVHISHHAVPPAAHILSELLSVIPFNEQPRDRTGVFFVCYLDHIERRMNIRNP